MPRLGLHGPHIELGLDKFFGGQVGGDSGSRLPVRREGMSGLRATWYRTAGRVGPDRIRCKTVAVRSASFDNDLNARSRQHGFRKLAPKMAYPERVTGLLFGGETSHADQDHAGGATRDWYRRRRANSASMWIELKSPGYPGEVLDERFPSERLHHESDQEFDFFNSLLVCCPGSI